MTVALRTRNPPKIDAGIDASNIIEDNGDSSNSKNRITRRRRRRAEEEEKYSDDDNLNEFNDDGTLKTEATIKTDSGNGRPFEVVAGLPCSLDIPQYNSALTAPLSVRDSAVLYNSLISSRRTWISGEMFEVYWTRANKVPSLAIKDASVLKELETSKDQDNTGKDRMQKMCDCEMLAGPHTFGVKLFIVKDEEIEKKWQLDQDSKKKEKEEKKKLEVEMRKKRAEEKKQNLLQKKQEREKQMQLQKEARARAKKEQAEARIRQREEQKRLKQLEKEKLREMKASAPKAKKEPSKKKADQNMIANLNMMAQRDPELKKLMAKVAGGQADGDEIEKFKKIIDFAKNMPPPRDDNPAENKSQEEVSVAEKKATKTTVIEATKTTKKLTETANKKTSDNSSLSNIQPRSSVVVKTDLISNDGIKSEAKNDTYDKEGDTLSSTNDQRASTEHRLNTTKNNVELSSKTGGNTEKENSKPKVKKELVNSTQSESINDVKKESKETTKKNKKKPVLKEQEMTEEEKDMQLTAFQQKYVNGAEIVIEFNENSNFRFLLPKKAIIENQGDAFKMSWLLVHNQKDIDRFKNRRIKELTKRIHNNEEKQKVTNEYEVYRDHNCPTPLFTSLTVTLKGIHRKFDQILLNSFDPIEQVQLNMKDILNIGTRLSGYNLWYQLDGYDDQNMAEELRIELNEFEQSLKPKRQKRN
ncbi:SWR1-complex protein 3 [Nakaseomyces bracarensis]|uniref:SWR1-complex protein 3 n=1 Tax=Nakaseomyces bracarensis TaxID=273131 RepID=A0ABR4NX14_9SACH